MERVLKTKNIVGGGEGEGERSLNKNSRNVFKNPWLGSVYTSHPRIAQHYEKD